MKYFFLFVWSILAITPLIADNDDDITGLMNIHISNPDDLIQSESGQLADWEGMPSTVVHNCVNVLTGSFCDHQTDLSFDGPFPFTVQRFYCSADHKNGSLFHGWNHNFSGVLTTNHSTKHLYAITQGRGGGEFVYSAHKKDADFKLLPKILNKGITNCRGPKIGGQSNIKNNRLHRIDNESFDLFTGAGEIHHYLKGNKVHLNHAPYLLFRSDFPSKHSLKYSFDIKEGIVRSHKIKKTELINSINQSVNWFRFEYPSHKDLQNYAIAKRNDQKCSQPIVKITTSDSREVIYTLDTFRGHAGKDQDKIRFIIAKAQRSCAPTEAYFYDPPESHHLERVRRKERPHGRYVNIEYYKSHSFQSGKVKELKAPLGKGPDPITQFTFNYHNSGSNNKGLAWTVVKDALKHQTIYRYNLETFRLDAIEKYTGTDNYCLYSKENYYWGIGLDHTNLVSKTLENAQGKILYCNHYKYDEAGNVLYERLYGNLTGHNEVPIVFKRSSNVLIQSYEPEDNGCEVFQKGYTYSKDGLNLITHCQDGNIAWEYHYKPGTSLLVAKLLIFNGRVQQREFFDYDENGGLTEYIIDDGKIHYGHPDNKFLLTGATERKIKRITNSKVNKHLGLPKIIAEYYVDLKTNKEKLIKKTVNRYGQWGGRLRGQIIYDSLDQPRYTLKWEYNTYGQPKKEINAIGEEFIKDYDLNGNRILEKNSQTGEYKIPKYDFANRLIAIDHYNSDGQHLLEEFEYDYLGQKILHKDIYGNETRFVYDDLGRCYETIHPAVQDEEGQFKHPVITKTFDELGNETSIKDPRGFVTTTFHTIRGDPYEKHFPDGTAEKYDYSLSGELLTFIARDGTRTEFKDYDYKSRPQIIEVYDAKGQLVAKETKKYTAFHLIQEIDPYGHETNYKYDGAGRLIQIEKGDRLTTFVYDSLGRQIETHEYFGFGLNDYINTIREYDYLNQLKKETLQDSADQVQSMIEYDYDSNASFNMTRTNA